MAKSRGKASPLPGRLLEAHDQDRRRVARRLHEAASQYAAALQINLSVLQRSAPGLPHRAARALAESLDLTQTLVSELRALSSELHPPLLDQFGLIPALQVIAQHSVTQENFPVSLNLPAEMDRLPEPMETALFRIVEESLEILRLSGSPNASLRIARDSKSLELEISAPSSARDVETARIDERARHLGGQFTLQTELSTLFFRVSIPAQFLTAEES